MFALLTDTDTHRTPRPAAPSQWLCALAVAAAGLTLYQPEARALGANQQLNLKVLVMAATGAEATFDAWTSALAREGIPYDTFVANTADP